MSTDPMPSLSAGRHRCLGGAWAGVH
jgi:hypothetical protein